MGKEWVLFMHALIRKQTIYAIYFVDTNPVALYWIKTALLKFGVNEKP